MRRTSASPASTSTPAVRYVRNSAVFATRLFTPEEEAKSILDGDDARAKGELTGVTGFPFTIAKDPEALEKPEELVVAEKMRRISWMADHPLVDEKRVHEQTSLSPEPPADLRKEPPVEEIDAEDVVHGFETKPGMIEIHLDDVDGSSGVEDLHQPLAGDVHGEDVMTALREKPGVSSASGGEVEGTSGAEERDMSGQKGLRARAIRIVASHRARRINSIPVSPVLPRHGLLHQSPREREHVDRSCSGPAERHGGCFGGSRGGSHVIDQKNAHTANVGPASDDECSPEIPTSLHLGQADLGNRRSRPFENAVRDAETEAPRGASRQELGLVESAAPEPLEVKRDRDEKVELRGIIRKAVREDRCQRRGHGSPAAVFQGAETGSERIHLFVSRAIAGDCPSPGKGRGADRATAAGSRWAAREGNAAARTNGAGDPPYPLETGGT